ncbi:MAG: hypothetical protein H6739_29535, partial [Alphaproteobacteria bacterium]|nr:hypothetical protein [Alphaproteobacteria bacterium]
ALAAGLLVALDGGLRDTALSGSEGYLAAVWLAAVPLFAARAAALAPIAWAFAVMNHPLALAALPLALLAPLRRAWPGWVVAAAALAPGVPRWLEGAAALAGGHPGAALGAWLDQGGLGAWAVLAGPLVGLSSPRTRKLAAATLLSGALLGAAGARLGYLRDHHLRLLTAPAVMGWAALPGAWPLVVLPLLRLPEDRRPPPGHPFLPGTVGRTTRISHQLAGIEGPLLVDGAWLGGTPAAEPGAVMLDLALRGRDLRDLGPGGTTAVILSYDHGQHVVVETFADGDRYALVTRDVEALAESLCGRARLGGAWDGMAALKPGIRPEEVAGWRVACGE